MGDDIRRVTGTILRAPFTRRTVRELLYCGVAGVAGVAGFLITVLMLAAGLTISASVLGTVVGLLLLTLALRVSRRLGGLHRRLAWWLLHYRVAWRGVSYSLAKLPVAAVQLYAITTAVIGLFDITYPVDWLLFWRRPNGPVSPTVALNPLPFGGSFKIYGLPGTFLAVIVGAAAVLAATWLARAI